MASEKGLIDDYQQSVMLQLIAEEYQESRKSGRTGSITGFALRCKKHEDKRIKDIGEQLGAWCEGGIYGHRFTDTLPPINFDSRFIVLELEELKGTPHLQTVVLMSIIQAAQHAMFIKKMGVVACSSLMKHGSTFVLIIHQVPEINQTNSSLPSSKRHGVGSGKQTALASVSHSRLKIILLLLLAGP